MIRASLPGARMLLGSGVPFQSAASAQAPQARLRNLLLAILVYGILYGAVMGTFSGLSGDRLLQVLYSALKVPMLLLVTFAISLPSFFVVNTLLGLRSDFADAIRALITTQAALTILLASLAPFTLVWYASSTNYLAAIALNAFMFGIASFAAQGLLRRLYRPLIARSEKHRLMLRAWIVIYAFVGIQMGWTLRPFIGDPTLQPRLFRPDAWEGNAYVRIAEIVWGVFRGWIS